MHPYANAFNAVPEDSMTPGGRLHGLAAPEPDRAAITLSDIHERVVQALDHLGPVRDKLALIQEATIGPPPITKLPGPVPTPVPNGRLEALSFVVNDIHSIIVDIDVIAQRLAQRLG